MKQRSWGVLSAAVFLVACGAKSDEQQPEVVQASKSAKSMKDGKSEIADAPSADAAAPASNESTEQEQVDLLLPSAEPEPAPDKNVMAEPDTLIVVAEPVPQEVEPVGDAGAEADGGLFGTGDLTVLVIADLSGSMATLWETKSRWETASDTLMHEMLPLQDWLTIGAIFFPVDEECGVTGLGELPQVPFMSGRGFIAAWEDSAANMVPGGSTPLGAAFRMADAAIDQAAADGRLEQRFRVVVMTDGEPNCDTTDGELEAFAASWFERGVETLVIGLPGSSAGIGLLNRIAAAGGTGEVDEQSSTDQLSGTLGLALR